MIEGAVGVEAEGRRDRRRRGFERRASPSVSHDILMFFYFSYGCTEKGRFQCAGCALQRHTILSRKDRILLRPSRHAADTIIRGPSDMPTALRVNHRASARALVLY